MKSVKTIVVSDQNKPPKLEVGAPVSVDLEAPIMTNLNECSEDIVVLWEN